MLHLLFLLFHLTLGQELSSGKVFADNIQPSSPSPWHFFKLPAQPYTPVRGSPNTYQSVVSDRTARDYMYLAIEFVKRLSPEWRDPSKTLNFRRRGSMGSREGDDKLTEVDKVSIVDPVTKVFIKDPVSKVAFKEPAPKVSIVDLVKSSTPHYNQLPVIKAEGKDQGNSNYKKKEVDDERRS